MEQLLPDNYMSNTTFNDSILIDTLTQIKKSSVHYIQEVQADLVGYHRFDFTMRDFKLDRSNTGVFTTAKRFVINVPKQLIPTASKEYYKKSDVFMKELSIKEIATHSKIFTYNFIVFIEGRLYTNLKIVIGEDLTRLVLYLNTDKITDGFDKDYFEQLLTSNANVTVYFIPNSLYGDLNTNKYVVKKYNNTLPLSKFTLYGECKTNSIAYSTVTPSNTIGALISSPITLDNDLVTVCESFEKELTSTLLNLGIINFKYFDRTIDIPAGGDYFELPIRQHVVPTSSIMAFYEEGGSLKFYHDLQVEYHYPNIYRVVGNDKPIILNIFYYEPSDNSTFVNEMELYYRFFGDQVLQKWKDGTIPDMIKNFEPSAYPVSIKNLLESQYEMDPLMYKTSKMDEFLNMESRKLGVYLQNMMKNRTKMRIYAKNVDLPSKLRRNVAQEIPTNPTVFKEDRYVFIFAKYFINEFNLRFFIDGKFYVCDQSYHDDSYYYFYIEANLINKDTIIDIEKHKSITYFHDVTFTKPIEPVFIHENQCLASDTLFIDENGIYLEEKGFKFLIIEDGNEIEIDTDSNKALGDNFKVKCVDNRYMNRPMSILFKRLSSVFTYHVETKDDEDKTMLIGTDLSRYDGHFRIYRNGRMLPPEVYTIKHKKKQEAYTVINIKMKKKVGDVYHIELNPNIFYTNYFSYKITTTGLLDFGGLLNKPFNLKWFDVFLNGYKLTEYNFDILTPRYVLIKGVQTTDNLLIMEKNWKNDVFKFRVSEQEPVPPAFQHNSCLDDKLFQGIKDFQDAINEIKKEIVVDDTIENVLTDIIEDTSDELIRYLPELFHHFFNVNPYINPDVMYTSEGEVRPEIARLLSERDNVLEVFPEYVEHTTSPVMINPDDNKLLDPDQLEIENGVIIH